MATIFKKGDRVKYSALGLASLRPVRCPGTTGVRGFVTTGVVTAKPNQPLTISVRMDGLKSAQSYARQFFVLDNPADVLHP